VKSDLDEATKDLTDDMLIYLDDKTLNKYCPLKKLAPYNDQLKVNKFMQKKKLYDLQKMVERKKVIIFLVRN
jgi:hypothetical protein